MKKAIYWAGCLSLLFLCSQNAIAQNHYSTIHIINRGPACTMYFNDKRIVGLNSRDVLEYKLHSKGILTMKADYSDTKAIQNLNSDEPRDYYIFYVTLPSMGNGGMVGAVKVIDVEKWNKEMKKVGEKISKEENLEMPIIKPE